MRPAVVNHHQRPTVQNFKLVVDPNLVGGSAPYYSFGADVEDSLARHDPREPVSIDRKDVDLPVPQFEDGSTNHISVISSHRGPAMAQDSINTFLDDYYEVFQKNMKERVSKCEPSNLIYVNTCDVTQPPPTFRAEPPGGIHFDGHALHRRTKHRQFPPRFDGEFLGIGAGVDGSCTSPTPSFDPRVPPPMFHRPNYSIVEKIRLPPLHIPPPPIPLHPPLPHTLQPPLPPSPPPQPPPLPPSDKTEEGELSVASRRKSQDSRHGLFSPPSTSGRRSKHGESSSGRTGEIEPSKLDLDSRIKLLLNDGPLGHLVPKKKTPPSSRKHSHQRPSPPSSHNTPLFEEHPDEPLSPPPSPFRSRAIYLKWHGLWLQKNLNTKKNFMDRASEPHPAKEKTRVIKADKSSIAKKSYDIKRKLKQVLQQQKADAARGDVVRDTPESPQRLQDPDSTVDIGLGDTADGSAQEAMVCDSSGSPAGTDGLAVTVQNVVRSVVGELTKDLRQELSDKLLEYMFGKAIENWGEMKSRGLPT
ncbi:vasodilator-stimulated phosphoprotein-like [Bacillus rossius redtenbacheri]|uniref:vasodilator-stimulated phosphoprotein-like n=1 Tax=Bacillus rossius redtenbacheri TaxID=93214 RepID=UPI002FDE1D5F